MKVQVTIPISVFKVLETSCAFKSPEDLMLKNGLIQEDRRAVKIRCDAERASSLVAWARQKVPDSAAFITVKPDM